VLKESTLLGYPAVSSSQQLYVMQTVISFTVNDASKTYGRNKGFTALMDMFSAVLTQYCCNQLMDLAVYKCFSDKMCGLFSSALDKYQSCVHTSSGV